MSNLGLHALACYTVAILLGVMGGITTYLDYHLSAGLLMFALALLLAYLGNGGTLRWPSGRQ